MSSQSGQPPQQPARADEDVLARTLKVHGLNTTFLYNCFSFTEELTSVKVIKTDETGALEGGDGFIEFETRAVTDKVYQLYHGTYMPDGVNKFKFEYPAFIPEENIGKYVISVANLPKDVNDLGLENLFKLYYKSVKEAKVEIDETSGLSKCRGFVKFADKIEHLRALVEMNGVLCSNLPMLIGKVTKENPIDMTIDDDVSSVAASDASNAQKNNKRKDREASTKTEDVSKDEPNVGDPASS